MVLADAGYGSDSGFRAELTTLQMAHVVGIQSTTTVWKPGQEPKPAPKRKGHIGRPRKLLQRDAKSQPVCVKELALSLPPEAWKKVSWRQGVKQKLQSRFAALRVRPAHPTEGAFGGCALHRPIEPRALAMRRVDCRRCGVVQIGPIGSGSRGHGIAVVAAQEKPHHHWCAQETEQHVEMWWFAFPRQMCDEIGSKRQSCAD